MTSQAPNEKDLKIIEAQKEKEKSSRVQKDRTAEADRLSQLSTKVTENTGPASQILAYIKEKPATVALAAGSVMSLASGGAFTAAALAAAAYFGAGDKLNNASKGTQLMAAASAAAFITGNPVIGVGLGIAAYAGVGKDFFKSAKEAKAESSANAQTNPSGEGGSPSAKEIASNLWDQTSQKMGFGGVPPRPGKEAAEDAIYVERQRGG